MDDLLAVRPSVKIVLIIVFSVDHYPVAVKNLYGIVGSSIQAVNDQNIILTISIGCHVVIVQLQNVIGLQIILIPAQRNDLIIIGNEGI